MSSLNRRQPNPVRNLFSAMLLFSVAGFSTIATATTITQSLSFRLNPDAATEILLFQPFDLSLGALESVEISFDATRRHDWAIWNISGQPAAIDYDASLTGTTLLLDGNSFGFADALYPSGNTGTLGSIAFPDFFTEFQAGRSQFIAGLDPDYPSAFNPAGALTTLANSFAPVVFSGELALSYFAGNELITGNNILTTSLVDIAGTASVKYTFTAVPDALPGLMLPVLLVGLLALAQVRRSEIKQVV